MKKNKLYLIMICLAAGLVFAGCTGSDKDTGPDDKPAESIEEPSKEEAEEPAETKTKPKEKSAETKIYRKFLDIVTGADQAKWDRFALIDLDGDGVFELFATCIDGEREDPGIQPYMIVGHKEEDVIKNDELFDGVAGAGGYRGSLYYLEGKGKLHESMVFAPLGEPADRVYLLKDGEITETDMGEFEADRTTDISGDDWDLYEHGEWHWNGRTVTEDEYKNSLREATDNTQGKPLSEAGWLSSKRVAKKLQRLMEGRGIEEEEESSDIEEMPEESSDIDEVGEPYCGVLYWYKQLQESGKSWDEMEQYNSQTALVQHGWPYSTDNDEVRYVYQDITGDGLIELIITYHGDPVDIYSNDGDAVYAYGVPYRAIAEIYPDGTIMEGLTMGTKGWSQTWYRYDGDTYKYVPVKESITPDTSAVSFPEGKKISDVVVPDGIDMID